MKSRLQSAMEYLMTYGWAILVIGVVLGALYYLGVFNPVNLAPREHPGSCSVYRPNGQWNTSFIGLTGTCNSGIPQYVASFSGKNGSYISLGNSTQLSPENGINGAMTFCMWYRINSATGYDGPMIKGELGPSKGNAWEYTLDQNGAPTSFTIWNGAGVNVAWKSTVKSMSLVEKQWLFSCFTYNYTEKSDYYYLNGTEYAGSFNSLEMGSAGSGLLIIGQGEHGPSNVSISNVQLYNNSLSSADIGQLYTEGIGGAPIALSSLVGWWPLNGNADDYSGNGQNGVAYNVTFTGAYLSGYSIPG